MSPLFAPMTLAAAERRLTALQQTLERQAGRPLSLAPDRSYATPLPQLLRCLVRPADDPALIAAFVHTLEAIVAARTEHFPDNLFGDLDYPAACLLASARAAADPCGCLDQNSRRIVRLQTLFGVQSPIRFRYVHDFIYGFDWARWVRRDPARRRIGPFDRLFLQSLEERGQQLLEHISGNDRGYAPVPPGQNRNPFPFSRQPADERRLHAALARDGLIPVAAWDIAARPRWDRAFSQLRQRRAEALARAQNINPPRQPATSPTEEKDPC